MTTFAQMQEAAASRRKKQRQDRSQEYREMCKKTSSPKLSRKAMKKQRDRLEDYNQMVSSIKPGSRNYSGYHRPGSANLRKG